MQPVAMTTKQIQTIADIARLAGVSKATVSRALNDSTLISAETRERIKAIADEHNFQRNDSARRLSLGTSHAVGLITYDYSSGYAGPNSFALELMSGITGGLHDHGFDLLVIQVGPEDTDWVTRYLDSGRVDGFILMAGSCTDRQIEIAIERGAPFVTWGIPFGELGYSWVAGDNVTGGRLATEHLLRGGRKRIAYLGGLKMLEVKHRFQGYEQALNAAGIEVDPALVTFGDFTPGVAAEAIRTLLGTAPDIDGVFANSDIMAVAAIDELRAHGRSVPGDVAVVGYDDIAMAAHADPPLTTISQGIPTAGRVLASTLVEVLRTGEITTVSLPPELVVRKSA
jgi:DNA-binding LacI/PurR family transcriptional regulator